MKQKSWLSLIEVLIAIVIFAVGILAVLRMVTHSLLTIDKVKIQTDAAMLASQGMQMVYTVRNTNLLKALPRNCAVTNELSNGSLGEEYCNLEFPTQWQALAVSMQPTDEIDSNPYFVIEAKDLGDFNTTMDAFRLYQHTGTINDDTILTWYNHDSNGGRKTPYARYISFEPVTAADTSYDPQYILEMKSVVLVQKGGFTGQIEMEGMIGSILH